MHRVIALLVLPSLLLAGAVPSYRVFRCLYDGTARRSCCCPPHGEPSPASLSEGCCCDVETISVAPVVLEKGQLAAAPEFPSVALPAAAPRALAQAGSTRQDTTSARSRAGPPLRLLKSSFLL